MARKGGEHQQLVNDLGLKASHESFQGGHCSKRFIFQTLEPEKEKGPLPSFVSSATLLHTECPHEQTATSPP